jgi:hypothetical protein
VALNGCDVPTVTVAELGVTAMDTSCGEPTESVVDPVTPDRAAVMVAEPVPELLATP